MKPSFPVGRILKQIGLYISVFSLSSKRTGESYGSGSTSNHTWIGSTHTRGQYAYPRVQAWTYVDSKSLCRTLSTIEPRRTSNFVCHCTNFLSKRMIRVDESDRRSILLIEQKYHFRQHRPDKQNQCLTGANCCGATINGQTRFKAFTRIDKFNSRISFVTLATNFSILIS